MFCKIPTKTFLIGEYAALQGHAAILLTTSPYFTTQLTPTPGLVGIHPQSPAGRFWLAQNMPYGLHFEDPLLGIGGLGASSAQFVGAYQLYCQVTHRAFSPDNLLTAYELVAWNGAGVKPSGYDLLAQASSGSCVFIDKNQQHLSSFDWPFPELAVLLLHTNTKQVTHEHLQTLSPTLPSLTHLGMLSQQAMHACEHHNPTTFIQTINDYHDALTQLGWVHEATQQLRHAFLSLPGIRAIKGCGAMGADILCLILDHQALPHYQEKFKQHAHWVKAVPS